MDPFPPGRPIISGNKCPTERISALVDHFLLEVAPLGSSYIKDTTHFLKILRDIGSLPDDALLVTLDVTSLYTNIPNNEGIEAARIAFSQNREPGSLPRNTTLLKLLSLVLKSNNFVFNGKNYLQVGGTAMGTIAAPNYAINFMNWFEEQFVYTYHQQPRL